MTSTRHASDMPLMGLGTYGRRGAEGQKALEAGLEIGYRLLDTAQDYGTEAQCGDALRASGLKRDDVFVTTKVRTGNLGPGLVVPSLEQSLETIGIDKLNLALIHWPSPNGEIAPHIYLEQIAEAHERGLARHIGVSNFTIALIDETRRVWGDMPIYTNQVEAHPFLQNRKLVDHCLANQVSITCYQPLAHGRVVDDPTICSIADEVGAGPDQVALAFLMQQGMAVIPSSARIDRMKRNFEALQIKLTDAHMQRMAGLDRGERNIDPEWGPHWD